MAAPPQAPQCIANVDLGMDCLSCGSVALQPGQPSRATATLEVANRV